MSGVILDPVTGRPASDLELLVPAHVAEDLRLSRLLGDCGPRMMADSKISALSDGSPLVSTDALAIARSGTSLKVLGSGVPGYEISYTQRTTNINVTSTTESSGTTILSPAAATFDGSPVLVHFFAPNMKTPTNAVNAELIVSLFEGASQITEILYAFTQATAVANTGAVNGFFRFTPSAASHTYTVTAFVTSTTGTPNIQAGTGSGTVLSPAFIRFTKV